MTKACSEAMRNQNGFTVFVHRQNPITSGEWQSELPKPPTRNSLRAQRRLLHQTKMSILVLIEAALDPLAVGRLVWSLDLKLYHAISKIGSCSSRKALKSLMSAREAQGRMPCCPERFT